MDRRQFIVTSAATWVLALLGQRAYGGAHGAKPTIALVGATARSGREIIRQGLEQGYKIKGLARTPSKLGLEHENLTMFKGDVRDQSSLEAMLDGSEVVICMVGRSAPSDPFAEIGEVDLYTVMGANLIAAMKAKGNTRLIMASSTGVEHRADIDGEKPGANDMSQMWRWNARYLYNDMYEMEKMIEASGLDYILLRPGFLVEEPARGDMLINTTGDTPGARIITYADFSDFVLTQLTGDDYLNRAVGLYSETVMDPQAEIEKFLAKQKEMQGQ